MEDNLLNDVKSNLNYLLQACSPNSNLWSTELVEKTRKVLDYLVDESIDMMEFIREPVCDACKAKEDND